MAELSGATLIARSLKQQGVEHMFGIVGIPVVPVLSSALKEALAQTTPTIVNVAIDLQAKRKPQKFGWLTQ